MVFKTQITLKKFENIEIELGLIGTGDTHLTPSLGGYSVNLEIQI